MKALRRPPTSGAGQGGAAVVPFAVARIERSLGGRTRYKYVHPRVEPEGRGWKVVSPNCSRNIDADGGDIDIAWLVPLNEGGWLLYARNHAEGCWRLARQGALAELLNDLCADPLREFWQ
ncbi:hypothetical protein [Pelomonas cellulosilytica]|uniref:DUF3024 domain-containing protein n=1 Tax=Pelomonas cellulosilytica TaxID=2906762 RepID=A0ABS8XVU1_9BURK|nr:hypothetical protein [Pelomonas sp. P8]MCE4556779.1 hypothetical protein [Pelomonas sp. P8]